VNEEKLGAIEVEDHPGPGDLCTDPTEETVRKRPVNVKDVKPLVTEKPESRKDAGHNIADTGDFETKAGDLVGCSLVVRQVLPSAGKVPEAADGYTEECLILQSSIRWGEDLSDDSFCFDATKGLDHPGNLGVILPARKGGDDMTDLDGITPFPGSVMICLRMIHGIRC
jgi:hypothetical protein